MPSALQRGWAWACEACRACRVMSGGSDVQVVNPTRPSKSCLRKSSWDDDDEIRTVVL